MNARTLRMHKSFTLLIISIFAFGYSFTANCQIFQEENKNDFFVEISELDSKAISRLKPSKAKRLYYVQDTFANQLKPMATFHGRTCGARSFRLDNQFQVISKKALKIGLNSIRIDSSKIDGIVCEYWGTLYRMKFNQIQTNEKIVMNNLLCVFGKFDNKYQPGKSFKINGRKIQLMPYEYVKRNIAVGKRGSVELRGSRLELVGGVEGGEAFYATKGMSIETSLMLSIGASLLTSPLGLSVMVTGGKAEPIPKTFAYVLYNIYNEKIVIAKTRDAMIEAKRKEWREKKAIEEAKKKAKEEKKD